MYHHGCADAAISQLHGIPENRVADQRAQRAANHHLYAPSQELLEVGDQAARKPWRSLTGHVDKQIYIALGRVFPTSRRAEKPDIARAVARGHPQYLVATLSDALWDAHSSIL